MKERIEKENIWEKNGEKINVRDRTRVDKQRSDWNEKMTKEKMKREKGIGLQQKWEIKKDEVAKSCEKNEEKQWGKENTPR